MLGRLAAHLMTLRNMSLSIAGMLERGAVPNVESALVKDLGTNLAKQVSEIARQLAQSEGVDDDEQFNDVLLESILYSPIHTIQGGTREILRGIIARELGLR
jgi:alkylation response protein AidB-like acyl-CoA dehydrogenase